MPHSSFASAFTAACDELSYTVTLFCNVGNTVKYKLTIAAKMKIILKCILGANIRCIMTLISLLYILRCFPFLLN